MSLLRTALRERLAIFPVQGQKTLRRFVENDVPVFASVSPLLEQYLRGSEVSHTTRSVQELGGLCC
jgi:hypothetical protein